MVFAGLSNQKETGQIGSSPTLPIAIFRVGNPGYSGMELNPPYKLKGCCWRDQHKAGDILDHTEFHSALAGMSP